MTLFSVRYCEWCGKQKEPINTCSCEVKIETIPAQEDDKMSESKIHVLPAENLGGVLREYVEVDRAANVGDKIVIVNPYNSQFGDSYTQGTIMTVTKADEDGDVYCGKFDLIDKDEYQTLEPTDVVVIDNQRDGKPSRFRLVDRKAKVGDKVIVFGHSNENGNGVFTVYDVYVVNDAISYVGKDGKYYGASSKNYRVLEPVEPAQADSDLVIAEEGDDKTVIDLLANLAHRLTTLEQQVARRVTELGKRVIAIDEHNDVLIDRINDAEEKIEMILDDIVTLDERTQPLATKKPSVAVAVRSIQQEFDGVFTKTEIDAYVASEGFCLNGTFEFKGSVKGPNDAAKIISEVFK
jgi:hypothetical protein